MNNKENYQNLFGISSDLKITCVKPDRCIYIMPVQSCSWLPPTSFRRRFQSSDFSKEIEKRPESPNSNDTELIKEP